jgi:hypothetical protein
VIVLIALMKSNGLEYVFAAAFGNTDFEPFKLGNSFSTTTRYVYFRMV